jgi:uncharacterized glyoxalase superfamily protein PhnB
MTTGTIYPFLTYDDAPAAIDWLCDAFGLRKVMVVPDESGGISHAELACDGGMIMLGSTAHNRLGMKSPSALGATNQGLYIAITDADAHYARAKQAGAEIVFDIKNEDYGSRGYTCRDPEGHLWSFGTYAPQES